MTTLEEALSGLGLGLEPEQLDRLALFERLLDEHAPRLGLISRQDLSRLRVRHIIDSLRAARAFGEGDRRAWDLGSGAGLPGLPLAIALPRCRFVLCEPKQRRAAFLELAVERLELGNVEVAVLRAEDFPPDRAEVCTARAFASIERSWEVACRLLKPGGRLVYFAGGGLADPRAAAEALSRPERPASVTLLGVLANAPPLVIMTRR
jgi:16S rRNA (guanine527-N7)-methyltransferase